MPELTVLCWYWRQPGGETAYAAAHVAVWAAMVKRHLSIPHRLAVVTDEPLDIPGVEIIPPPREFETLRIPSWPDAKPQCLRRLAMFRADAAAVFGERFVCMDLDCVISGPLDPLFTRHDFRIMKGTAPGRPFNGSMMMLKAGARPQVYEQFTHEGAIAAGRKFLGSDQAWISHVLGPAEAVWDVSHGVDWWKPGTTAPLLFFPGSVKPWEVIRRDPFVAEHYRRDESGRGLILGRGKAVWDEAEAALDRGQFDGVIALHEAARHWPGPVDALADDEGHAVELAAMLGFGETVFCGRALVG